ncbi:MAG: hypothetical protein DI585_02045 [Pseudomonas fluorescens]|nr:MAG: hypothetical protein DI585_02045 [Pseudomonas fluorescens]
MLSLQAVTFEEFRGQARRLILAGVTPDEVTWLGYKGLFGGAEIPEGEGQLSVPKPYVQLARSVACHADALRWNYLYRALWRIQKGEARLLHNPADPLVSKLNVMAKQVGRDIHKMHAFVRFRKTEVDGLETYLAWHCPDHRILTLAAPFFVNRFRHQRWGIATPLESCSWDGEGLVWGEGLPQNVMPAEDAVEELWRTYYRHIFNPARIKIKMMKSEMPVRHWRTLPETQDIAQMLKDGPERVEAMLRHAVTSSDRSLKRATVVKRRMMAGKK